MLHAGEAAAHQLDGLHRHLAPDGGGSGQQILNVVQAPQLHVLLGEEGSHDAVLCHAEHPVLPQERAVVRLVQAGEPDLLALAVLLHGAADLVLIAEDGAAGLLLVEQDVPLGVDVLLHILVVVEVVGGHVGDDGDVGALVHTDELEAGQLHHGHVVGAHLGQHGQQGCADVAAQMHPAACGLVELGDKGGGGGLAVRAGHGHDLAGAELEEQLHLAGDHGAGGHGVLQRLLEIAHEARGAHDDVLPLEAVEVILAEAQIDAQLLDGGGVVAEIFHALFLVAEGDVRPQLHELPDERLMADARADKGNLFALDEVCKLLLFLLHKKGPPL